MTVEQAARLSGYVDLLAKWNRVYNLTAIHDRGAIVERHVDDCLSCIDSLSAKWPPGKPCRLLDVGSGGGLPGAIIAIMLEHVEVTCIDAVGKKAAFVQQAASTLGLSNLCAIHVRAEEVRGKFDVITCRAFSSLHHFVDVSEHALAIGGNWLAMKGAVPQDELDELDPAKLTFHVEQILETNQERRCLIWVKRAPSDKSALALPIDQ